MRVASRTIATGVVGLVLAVAAGCGSKPAPSSEPNVTLQPEPGPNPDLKTVHEMDPAKHVIPSGPVSGKLGGVEVTPAVMVEGDYLVFRTTKPGLPDVEREVLLKLRDRPSQPLPTGRRVVRVDTPAGGEVLDVLLGLPGKQMAGYPNGYAMTLELEPRKAGKIAGKVYLSLPDDEKSYLAGTFVAAAPRLLPEPPGVDDVPLVNGSVTVTGAGPGAVLMTGYAAAPNGTASQIGVSGLELELGGSAEMPQIAHREDDAPRVTNLMAGDGKSVPSRYEHSKLTPGRYLVFAALKNGPAAWKWVDVGEKSTVAADLTVDATKTGGLEVTAPLAALGKVQLAPVDDPTRPLDANLFTLIAMQMKLEQDIVARKALFKNLAPGRYEVRAAGEVRVVEVVAGKTMELDFDAKPMPKKDEPDPKKK